MAFDFNNFLGSFGKNLMGMGGGGQAQGGGMMQQQAPMDLSFLQALLQKKHASDLLPRYDQQQPQRIDPGMQMFMGHSNHLTGGY